MKSLPWDYAIKVQRFTANTLLVASAATAAKCLGTLICKPAKFGCWKGFGIGDKDIRFSHATYSW